MARGKFKDWIKPEGLTLLQGWARNGMTDEQIAARIGVSRSTLSNWKKNYPRIREALKKGKDVFDDEVEETLFKAALGYEYTESETYVDDQGNQRVKKYTRYAKPDTRALSFWLKNRRPEKWSGKAKEREEKEEPPKRIDNLIRLVRKDA